MSAPSLPALRRLAPYAWPFRVRLGGAVLAAFGAAVAALAVPLLLQQIVDGPIATGQVALLPWLVAGVLALGLADAALNYLRARLVVVPATQIEATLRAELYAQLQRMPVAFHDRWPSGQLLSRAGADLSAIRSFVSFVAIYAVVNVLTIVMGAGVLLWLSPWFGLIIVIMAGLVVVTCYGFERRYAVATRRSRHQVGELATMVEESALGVRVLKSFGRGGTFARQFTVRAAELRSTELGKVRLVAWLWVLITAIPGVAMAAVLGVGAAAVAAGTLSLGALVAAVGVLSYLFWPVVTLGWMLSEATDTATACERYWQVRDASEVLESPPHPRALAKPVRGAVRLAGVRFGYPGAATEVLRGVDLELRPGETLALVGPTGGGKTTLTALLPRYYDVTGGRITLDGVDVRELALGQLRRVVVPAFEDPTLFSASVRDNVLLGASAALGDGEVWRALRVAAADCFVAALPAGLDTRIGEQGMTLSGGQRQRLALARAVIGQPAVLVADDPLSALDVHTEAEVETALRRVLRGVTALVVAHRPSTVRLADRVAVLDDGRIAAVGTHAELVATSVRYRELMAVEEPVRHG